METYRQDELLPFYLFICVENYFNFYISSATKPNQFYIFQKLIEENNYHISYYSAATVKPREAINNLGFQINISEGLSPAFDVSKSGKICKPTYICIHGLDKCFTNVMLNINKFIFLLLPKKLLLFISFIKAALWISNTLNS